MGDGIFWTAARRRHDEADPAGLRDRDACQAGMASQHHLKSTPGDRPKGSNGRNRWKVAVLSDGDPGLTHNRRTSVRLVLVQ